jgi:hypothetical protein
VVLGFELRALLSLYHHLSPFVFSYFTNRVLHFLLGASLKPCFSYHNPICASCIVGIIELHHHAQPLHPSKIRSNHSTAPMATESSNSKRTYVYSVFQIIL